jgi:hypothetical protein
MDRDDLDLKHHKVEQLSVIHAGQGFFELFHMSHRNIGR